MSGKPCSRVSSRGSFRAWSSGRSEGDLVEESVSGELEVGDDAVPDAEEEGDSSRGILDDGGDSVPVAEDEGDWDP